MVSYIVYEMQQMKCVDGSQFKLIFQKSIVNLPTRLSELYDADFRNACAIKKKKK